MRRQEPIYSDINLSLDPHPLSRDIQMVFDEQAVRRSILRIIKLRRFDKPYEGDKHAFIDEFLFDPASVATSAAIRERLDFAFKKMETRATFRVEVAVGSRDPQGEIQGYELTIHYEVKALDIKGSVQEFLQRMR